MPKSGRNDLCPCGSGKKYKKCCLKKEQESSFSRSTSSIGEAFKEIIRFTTNHSIRPAFHEAMDFFSHENSNEEPDEWMTLFSIMYACFGFPTNEDGDRIIDLFLKKRSRSLSSDAQAEASNLSRARPSLFEVCSVMKGLGIRVLNLVSNDKVMIRDISITSQIRKGDIFFAWIYPAEKGYIIAAEVLGIPQTVKNFALSAFLEEIENIKNLNPSAALPNLAAAASWIVVQVAIDYFNDPPLPEFPKLMNMDKEELVFCESHFKLNDEKEARKRLSEHLAFEKDKDGFIWSDPKGRQSLGEGSLLLGRIEIRKKKLILHTNSRTRTERGKKILIEVLREAVSYLADSLQDPKAVLGQGLRGKRKRDHRETENDALDTETKKEFIGQYLKDYYTRWMDEPVPALGNISPREAAKTAKGRLEVEELLTEMEARNDGNSDMEGFDFFFIRKELKLEQIVEDIDFQYNANVTPDPKEWLALDEAEKSIMIEAYHDALEEDHPVTENMRIHATMHCIVENQLAGNDIPEVNEAMARLLASDLSRHDALHKIAAVTVEEIYEVLKKNRGYDRESVERKLSELGR